MEKGSIYGLQCTCHPEQGVRYVGQTTQPLPRRLAQHRSEALREHSGAIVYKWMRRHGTGNVRITLLQDLPHASATELDAAEAYWIRRYRLETMRLLNTWTPFVHPSLRNTPIPA